MCQLPRPCSAVTVQLSTCAIQLTTQRFNCNGSNTHVMRGCVMRIVVTDTIGASARRLVSRLTWIGLRALLIGRQPPLGIARAHHSTNSCMCGVSTAPKAHTTAHATKWNFVGKRFTTSTFTRQTSARGSASLKHLHERGPQLDSRGGTPLAIRTCEFTFQLRTACLPIVRVVCTF